MTKVKEKKHSDFWERNRKSGGYLLRKTVLKYGISICRFVLLFGMCFLILQPILNKVSVSFMEEKDLYDPTVVSIPTKISTSNYEIVGEILDYGKTLTNSFVVALTIAILQIAMTTLVGYGFARFEFPFKKILWACVMLTVLIPPQTISSSLHLHFRFFDVLGIIKLVTGESLNLKDSAIPYYLMSLGCMGLKNGLYIYMIRQFFRNIPKELEEAAYVDGCGTLKTFLKIMLPDATPILTSCFLFSFVWQWTDGFYSKLFLGNIRLLSTSLSSLVDRLAVYMQRLLGFTEVPTISPTYSGAVLSTGVVMFIVPLIVLYLFAQKGFVESLSSSGIKM